MCSVFFGSSQSSGGTSLTSQRNAMPRPDQKSRSWLRAQCRVDFRRGGTNEALKWFRSGPRFAAKSAVQPTKSLAPTPMWFSSPAVVSPIPKGPVSRYLIVSSGSRAAARGTHRSIARRWARYGPSPAVRLIPCALLGNPRGISCAHGIALFILFGTQPTTADDTGGTT